MRLILEIHSPSPVWEQLRNAFMHVNLLMKTDPEPIICIKIEPNRNSTTQGCSVHSCSAVLKCRKCLWFTAAGGWRSHPLLSRRRNDQVHGSHTACGLLPAERRRTADPVELLRYPASLITLVDACLSLFPLDGVLLPLVPSLFRLLASWVLRLPFDLGRTVFIVGQCNAF